MSEFNPFRNRFPYTNINDINLDWIIKKVKQLGAVVSSYAADIANALAAAEQAQETAESVSGTAAQALSTAQAAETTANNIAGTAAQALSTAQAAETTANNIAGTAAQALTTAQAAETTAQAAESTAQAAETTAQAAESTAREARTTASQAVAKSSNAAQAANTALSTADTASVVARDASATASTAEHAANTAQQTADTALSTANTAQQTADTALLTATAAAQALDAKAGALIDTVSGAIATFLPDSTIQAAIKNVSVAVEPVQAGSGEPAPDNVRPISGWNGANVYRTGVNLLDISTAEVGTAWNGAANTARARLVIPIKRNTQYILTMNGTNSLDGVFSALSTTVPPSGIGKRTFPYSFNSGENDYLVLGFNKTGISQSDLEALNLQLEPGSAASSYHPYAGNRYTITLGETVYGGTLDVTNGVLTVTDANIASYNGEILPGEWISDRDVYAAGTTPTTGAQVVYKLATPITITLDPVTISDISGQLNNIWSPAGAVSVEYAADLKWYIDNKLVELQALVLENGG